MKRNLLAVLLIVMAVSCDKQDISETQADSFVKYYNNYPEFSAADVVQVNQSGYAILGTAKTYAAGTQLCLLRTNKFGNAIDSARFYGRSLDDQAYCLKVMPDKGFAMLGSSRNPVTENLDVYLIRTDSVGNVLWTRTIEGTGNIEARHFEVDNAGSFFMAGYCEVVNFEKQIWWFALKEDGSNLWLNPRTFGYDKDDESTHLQILQDGGLVITGYTEGAFYKNAIIILTDINGVVDNFFSIASATDEAGTCVRALDDNNFLLLGTTATTGGSNISLFNVYLSSDEQVVHWKQTYGDSDKEIGNAMLADDNAIYMLGTSGTSETNTAISLITADALGNQLARSAFGLGSQLSGCSFQRTADGGFIIAGTNKHSDNSISVALIKTGADATF
jgi:hypothetical protein